MNNFDPVTKLYNYACNKMYRVIYNSYIHKEVEGILINCHGSFIVLLGELGLYLIEPHDIQLMEPIPMPKKLCDNYRNVIETYLKEEAALGGFNNV